jgi:hypothetical protein
MQYDRNAARYGDGYDLSGNALVYLILGLADDCIEEPKVQYI